MQSDNIEELFNSYRFEIKQCYNMFTRIALNIKADALGKAYELTVNRFIDSTFNRNNLEDAKRLLIYMLQKNYPMNSVMVSFFIKSLIHKHPNLQDKIKMIVNFS